MGHLGDRIGSGSLGHSAVTFELVTDSKVVSALLKKEIPSRRANWVIRLSEFHFTITHRKGELNRNADFFSRCVFDHVDTYQNWCEGQILKKGLPPIVSKGSSMNALEAKESKDDPQVFEDEDIKSLDMNVMLRHIAKRQKEDPKLNRILIQVESGAHAERMAMKGAPDDLKIEENGALLKRIWIRTSKLTPPKEYWPVLAPKSLINAILQMFHGNDSLLGHSGRHKTYSTLRERFTWRGMSFALAKWIRSCHHCLGRKGVPPQHRRYNLYEETQAPMNRIAVDIVGPLTTSKRGNQYIMTMFCPFSHWPEAFPLARTTAEEVITCLKKHISVHSVPAEILSDRGKNFMSQKVKEFLTKMGTRKTQTSPYKPSSNGSVEASMPT